MLQLILFVFIAAVLAGIISGLLGGGIGLVLVPVLAMILQAEKVNPAVIMHVAIGSTMVAITVMGLVASYSHHKRQAIVWPYLYRMIIGLIIGIVLGAFLANALSSMVLMRIFGSIALLLGIYTLLVRHERESWKNFSYKGFAAAGFIIGMTGSLIGVNTFAVPFFRKVGLEMPKAVGSSIVLGTVMAIGIAVMFIINGWHQSGLPPYSTGYINWPLTVPIIIAGTLFAPLGAKIAHSISPNKLRVLYGLLLIIVAINMLARQASDQQACCVISY